MSGDRARCYPEKFIKFFDSLKTSEKIRKEFLFLCQSLEDAENKSDYYKEELRQIKMIVYKKGAG